MQVSDKQKAYSRKHIQEKLDEIKIRPPKGTKDRWAAAAAAEGKSLQRFIIDIVDEAVGPQEATEEVSTDNIKAAIEQLLANEEAAEE